MFPPISWPGELVDAVPTSIVGLSDPCKCMRYEARKVSSSEVPLTPPLSAYLRYYLSTRDSTKGTQNSANSIAHRSVWEFQSPAQDSLESAALASEVKASIHEILGNLNDESLSKTDKTLSEKINIDPMNNIHSLGENNVDVLQRSNVLQVFEPMDLESEVVGLDSFVAPADASLKQDIFDISTVFDPNNFNDLSLFKMDRDMDEDDELSEENTNVDEKLTRIFDKLAVREKDENGLDSQLDRVIGEAYNTWENNKSLLKKAWKSGKKRRSEDDIWASEDKIDISDFHQLVPQMAIEYSFNLDVFQKRAIYRLERDESVFVAAHTSAGKTVVAEYAIALAMQRKMKVVYTSPIKTLSNQKFRDFTDRFGDVGIITGDVSINPEASCLVMTTEILRSMLYKGADLIRDLSHVIFDECHWLNDPERGVVWEEALILLPVEVNIIMLSATVPNALEFAKWVGRTKKRQVYVVSTPKRPVPLSHQLYVKGEVYPLFESSQKRFLDANYRRASSHHKESNKNSNIRHGGGRNHAWVPIIKYLQKRALDPAIFFCFSKKKCNEAADQLHAQDLTSGATDKNQIHMFFQNAIGRLSASDRNLPQIARHREMLKRGIGVHHAGVLPIVKEITEVLFQKGLVRILFATETFAMGVNMPARTVVFTAIQKFDSRTRRLLEPGEYVQMAGRAGRRGLDDVGIVLLYPSAADFPSESDVKAVLTGTPKPLRSQFRLTYNMILNLLRIDELRVEDVMARSFSEAPTGRTSNTVKKLIEKGREVLTDMHSKSVQLERYRNLHQLSRKLDSLNDAVGGILANHAKNATGTAISAGRVVLLRGRDQSFRLGVILRAPFAGRSKGSLSLKSTNLKSRALPTSKGKESVTIKVLALCGGPAVSGSKSPYYQHNLQSIDIRSEYPQYNAGGLIVEIRDEAIRNILSFAALRIEVNERGLVPIRGKPNPVAIASAAEQLRKLASDEEIMNKFPDLHPINDLGLQDLDVADYWDERRICLQSMNNIFVDLIANGAIADLENSLEKLAEQSRLSEKVEKLRLATSDDTLQLMPDYRQRAEVLTTLGYIDGTSVRLKGRAACEVNTCESIILTEMVFEKIVQKLSAVDLAALLCSLIFHEKVDGEVTSLSQVDKVLEKSQDLYEACQAMLGVLKCLGNVQAECGLPISPTEYVRSNANFGFLLGVRCWAEGKSFVQVCEEIGGSIPEGSIVRTIVRLCELLRELKNVGRVIGDPDLSSRAEEAIGLIRRDVIFAASLYIQ